MRWSAIIFAALLLGAAGPRDSGQDDMAPAMVAVCFVPAQACEARIAAAIDAARTSVRVQAYGFTAPAILDALAAAKARGVDVRAILDKSDDSDHVAAAARPTGARFAIEAGIPTWIDDHVAIAHNKVIVIDGHLVIGGSYNYTVAAERRNAENVTFMDSPAIAAFYLRNWEARRAASRPSRFDPSRAVADLTAR